MKIGFIGFGHMATAIFNGLVRANFVEPREVYACASDYEKLKERAAGLHVCRTASEVAQEAGIVFVCVKPGQVEEIIRPIRNDLRGCILISVAFGLDFDAYEKMLSVSSSGETGITDSGIKHISIIPNTPCEVCQGITIIEDRHNLSDPELEIVKSLLKKIGEIEFVSTEKMWLAGEVSSCGPAFAAMFIEALGDAGAKYGLDRESAYRIVSQMVAGTGRLQIEMAKNPGQMVDEVATPGGVTIRGVTARKEANFHDVVARAIDGIEESK